MGCFCRDTPAALIEPFEAPLAVEPQVPLVAALGTWFTQRWLPATVPWAPDPAWLEVPLPEPPLPSASVSVLLSLVLARETMMDVLQLDPLVPADLARLTRVIATLNLRLEALRPLAEDWRPWSALAQLDGQVETVQEALEAGLFEPDPPVPQIDPALPVWRRLLARLLALAPLVALTRTLRIELHDPDWPVRLGAAVRPLRLVALPALADVAIVLRLVARNDAMERLQARSGPLPFREARQAVAARVRAVQARLPPAVRMEQGVLVGMPALPPNLALIVNAPAVAAVARLVLPRLDWLVPRFEALPLLTSGVPAASLVKGMTALGPSPVRASPCGPACDAAAAVRALASRPDTGPRAQVTRE